MNLNNWLCKHFDKERKGYVTIWNIIDRILSMVFSDEGIAFMIVTIVIPILIGFFYIIIRFTKEEISSWSFLFSIREIFLSGYTSSISIVLFFFVLYKISQIKIAKCPLKEDDKK